jgi:hypothetical protein
MGDWGYLDRPSSAVASLVCDQQQRLSSKPRQRFDYVSYIFAILLCFCLFFNNIKHRRLHIVDEEVEEVYLR